MNSKALKIFRYLLGWPISVISLFFILRVIFLKSSSITHYLSNLNISLIFVGVFFFLLYYFGRGFLWQKMLEKKGYNLRLKEITYIWGTSELKRYTPGNIWSFLSRGLSLKDKGIDKKNIFSLFLLEFVLIVLSSLTLTIFSISWIFDIFPDQLNTSYLKNFIIYLIVFLDLLFIFSPYVKKKLNFFPVFSNSPASNLNLLTISTVTMFFFGLGSYFTASSITPLMLSHIVVFSSLFVFALLIGYISIITPMGLGVREGIVIWFLLPIIRLNLAAAISIFTRIFLMLSELIFLILVYLWFNLKNQFMLKIEIFISKNRYFIGVLFLVLIYVIYFSIASFLRVDNFYAGRFDLGNMDQVVWNTLNGRFFEMTNPNGTNTVSRLAFHADFILILLSPFYLLWQDPKMLLLIQSIVLGLGGIFVYLISDEILKKKNLSLIFTFSFLTYPGLQYVNLYDFHPVSLSVTFLLATFYFLLKRRYFLFLIFLLLSAITKEEIWLVVLLFGLYLIYRSLVKKINKKKELIIGFILTLLSVVIFYVLIFVAIPALRGGEHFALTYYSDFGGSPGGVIGNILFSPIKIISIILEPERLYYLYQLLLHAGFLPIFAPQYMVFALPDLLINILSNNKQLHQIYYQYTSAIIPFVFISSIYSVNFLRRKVKFIPLNFYFWFILFFSLLSAYLISPMPGSKHPNINMFVKQLENKKLISDFIEKIPRDLSVAATNNLGAHLSQREKIYTIPQGTYDADIVLFLLNDSFAQPSLFAQKEMAKEFEKDSNYILLLKDGDFVAFQKKNIISSIDQK